MHPKPHMSRLGPYVKRPSWRKHSGGRYQRVATRGVSGCVSCPSKLESTCPSSVRTLLTLNVRDSPKSQSLRTPLELMRRFAGLRSRWSTPRRCRYASACRSCFIKHLRCARPRRMPRFIKPWRSCSQYSITRKKSFGAAAIPCLGPERRSAAIDRRLTTFGCLRDRRSRSSRSAVMGKPSVSRSVFSRFRASASPLRRSRASVTSPYVPSPTTEPLSTAKSVSGCVFGRNSGGAGPQGESSEGVGLHPGTPAAGDSIGSGSMNSSPCWNAAPMFSAKVARRTPRGCVCVSGDRSSRTRCKT
mmetsp:Transcript_18422/g.59942  ORF Transcript_18422/g.59942 Transcript_18422/m.59942 type:complete len:302 (-) Transcript_18422:39-944(-)